MRNSLLLITLLFLFSCSETVVYKAGFKTIHAFDKSRIYKPNSDTTDYLHYRPLDLDIWYPAIPAEHDTTLLFRNILGLLDKRANYYAASSVGNGMSQQIAQLFCTGFKCSDTNKLLNFKTASFQDAAPA